jgi:ribonuclease T1
MRRDWSVWWILPLVLVVGWWWWGNIGPQSIDEHLPEIDTPAAQVADDPLSGLPYVSVADLPSEAADTIELIKAGGPFPEDEDGSVFENREDLLPDQPFGYYREYTVPTPGSDDRGARRIVVGDGEEYYWTGDHYRSFERIENP